MPTAFKFINQVIIVLFVAELFTMEVFAQECMNTVNFAMIRPKQQFNSFDE